MEVPVKIGHINLARSFNGTGEHIVALVEALDRQGIAQHVIVRNRALARRLAVYESVTIGPVTRSPLMAYCLMPEVAVAHIHDARGAQSGLLLTLTRSTPYVLTRRNTAAAAANPIARSIQKRAAWTICCNEASATDLLNEVSSNRTSVIADITRQDGVNIDMIANRAAAAHLNVYRQAVDHWSVPALLL